MERTTRKTMQDSAHVLELLDNVDLCPLCGSKQRVQFCQITHLHISLSYWLCKECGLVYLSPRMTEEQYHTFYQTEYRILYHGQAEPPCTDLDEQEKRAAHLARIVSENIKMVQKRHLDVGCGAGALVKGLQNMCGCRSEGVEPDEAYRLFARTQGLTVYASIEDWKQAGGTSVNLVTMSHVLEHLTDPVGYLSDLRREVLVPGEWLLIEVPNLYVHYSCFEVAHNFAFSSDTLKEVVRKAGFAVCLLKKHGIPKRRSPIYLTLLAKAMNGPMPQYKQKSNSRGVRLKRVAGVCLSRIEGGVRRLIRLGYRASNP